MPAGRSLSLRGDYFAADGAATAQFPRDICDTTRDSFSKSSHALPNAAATGPPLGNSSGRRPSSLLSVRQPQAVNVKDRSFSLDSPTSPHFQTHQSRYYVDQDHGEDELLPRDLDVHPHGNTPRLPSRHNFSEEQKETNRQLLGPEDRGRTLEPGNINNTLDRPRLDRSATSYHTAQDSVSDYDKTEIPPPAQEPEPVIMQPSRGTKYPNLSVNVSNSAGSQSSPPNNFRGEDLKKSKSPGLGGFFGWRKGSTNRPDSPTTTFSDSRSVSPAPFTSPPPPMAQIQNASGARGASTWDQGDYFTETNPYYGPSSPGQDGQHNFSHTDELLRELREVSTELAASIAREMELEDEIDRAKTDMPTGPIELTRRTSDYYSDSGASVRGLPLADNETKLEALEKMRRKAEQDKAQVRLEMSQRAQEELNQRRALELHVQSLEEQLRTHQRKLAEERGFKENFEDLMAGMRQEMESHRNERDNLRDEVVPGLQARVDGLESQAADMQNLVYENSRMQQENQSLRNENQTLANARRLQLDMQQGNARFRSIAEDPDGDSPRSPNPGVGLSRTNSLARTKSVKRLSGSQARGKDGLTPIEASSDSLKDLEDQRDALHRTLKSLILRQEVMTKTHAKKLSALQSERDNAMTESRRRAEFRFETQHLRGEINHLRRRADDAMEQKWQCEKGLSGLKMDLDRAQQETSSLRDLLNEGEQSTKTDNDTDTALNTAYTALRSIHADTTMRLSSSPDDHTTSLLSSTDTRMQALSRQIEDQLSTNVGLRARLAETIERGVTEQQASAKKITDLETALQAAEERVHRAANESEEAVSSQEEFVRGIKESAEEQSRRGVEKPSLKLPGELLGLGLTPQTGVTGNGGAKSPLFGARSPRLGQTSSGRGVCLAEASRTDALEGRVGELEKTALGADREMQNVIEKMNRAQIEVAKLQAERDDAIRQTRRLQREIVEEKERIKALVATRV